MARVIDIRPILTVKQLRGSQYETGLRIARTVCQYLGIAPDGSLYKRFIIKTPCVDHREAVLYWMVLNKPEALGMMNLRSIRDIASCIDYQVRGVIPNDLFWSHD